jgi:hypothetical protein
MEEGEGEGERIYIYLYIGNVNVNKITMQDHYSNSNPLIFH